LGRDYKGGRAQLKRVAPLLPESRRTVPKLQRGISMKATRFLVLAAAALFVAACLPVTSKHPIGSTVGFKQDQALIGLWKTHGDDKDSKDGYLAFLKAENGAMTAILFAPDDDEGEWDTFSIQAANLGANHVMNLRMMLKDGKPSDDPDAKEIIPMFYKFGADGSVTLALLDDKATKAAIESGKLEGTVQQGDMGDVRITAEPARLDAFFASRDAEKLFTQKLLVLTKVQ
jgi:hypothetical protein